MKMQMHAYLAYSRAIGPGVRAVVWFQGCTLRCPGCFNPTAQAQDGGEEIDTAALLQRTTALEAVEGFTFSGGEPFQQPEALFDVVQKVHQHGLTVIVFSGYELAAINRLPLGPAILAHIDTLIAGPYDAAKHAPQGLVASVNQQVHHLTARYAHIDFTTLPNREAIIHPHGGVTLTGIEPLDLSRLKLL